MVIKTKINNNKFNHLKEVYANLDRHHLYIEKDPNYAVSSQKQANKVFAVVLKKLVGYGTEGFVFDKTFIASGLTKKEAIRIIYNITADYKFGKEFCDPYQNRAEMAVELQKLDGDVLTLQSS